MLEEAPGTSRRSRSRPTVEPISPAFPPGHAVPPAPAGYQAVSAPQVVPTQANPVGRPVVAPVPVPSVPVAAGHPPQVPQGCIPAADVDAVIRGVRAELQAFRADRRRPAEQNPIEKPGLRKMYGHNLEIMQEAESGLQVLDGPDPDCAAVQRHFEAIRDMASRRLKLIKIANLHGWEAVEAYEQDVRLGDDKDDAKRIRAAVSEAESRKKKAEAQRKLRPRSGNRASWSGAATGQAAACTAPNAIPGPVGVGYSGPPGPQGYPFTPPYPPRPLFPGFNQPYGQWYGGWSPAPRCYVCNEVGHYSRRCPRVIGESSGSGGKK